MVMTNTEKLKLAGIFCVLAIPIVMMTPFGLKMMHDWGVTEPGSKFWLGTAITVADLTLQGENAATWMREYYLLWPNEPDAGETLYKMVDKYMTIARTAEKSDQFRLYSRSWDVIERMQKHDFEKIVVEHDDGEDDEYPLKGISTDQKAEVVNYKDFLERFSQKNFGENIWPPERLETWAFPDQWDRKKVLKSR